MRLRDRFLLLRSSIKVPAAIAEGRPWVGYLLLSGLLLCLLAFLATVAALLYIAWAVGGREGDGGVGAEFSKGFPIALWWLFGLLSVVPISLFYLWWHFSRGSRPMDIHADLKAAQAGDAAAAHRVGRHYRDRDPSSSRAWLAKAAQAGLPEAMVELAQELRAGRGGPRDLASARGWLLRASALGDPEARALLAEVDAQLGDIHSERGI